MAFKLKSGNGPLQFKQMGAAPVKQTPSMTPEELKEKKANDKHLEDLANTPGTDEYYERLRLKNIRSGEDEYAAEQKIKKEKAAKEKAEEEAKAKVDATRGTHEGQIKKQAKLDKIQSRQDRRYVKKANKAFDKTQNKLNDITTTEDKLKESKPGSFRHKMLTKKLAKQQEQYKKLEAKENEYEGVINPKETRREKRLKKEVAMTPEEYEANQAAKQQRYQDAMNRLAMVVHPDFDPAQVAQFDEQIRTRGQREESQRINDAYKAAETARIQNALNATNAYHAKKEETNQLSTINPTSIKNDGTINDE